MADQKQPTGDISIYQIRIDLKGIRPPIWRRLLMPSDMPLDIVHHAIQIAMGWDNEHLHMFTSGGTAIGDPTTLDGDLDTLDEQESILSDVLVKVGDKLKYEYDFGDGWEHTLKLEKILRDDPDVTYPVCVAGKRACPPEDVGGIWGYQDCLDALANPEHPEHLSTIEWIGEDFDPEYFDPEEATAELHTFMAALAEEEYMPHAITAVRFQMLSPEVADFLMQSHPPDFGTSISISDVEHHARRIRAAKKPGTLLDLMPVQYPVLIPEWTERIRTVSHDIAPLLARRLVHVDVSDPDVRFWIQGRLACALHRLGSPAVQALLEVFDALDEPCKALACIVLGQLHVHEAADRIWRHFESAFEEADNTWAIGPLWALVDLEDPRIPDAISRALQSMGYTPELAAIAGRFGDQRVLMPLLDHGLHARTSSWTFAGAAAILVAHRVPRQVLIEEFRALPRGPEDQDSGATPEDIVDLLLSLPTDAAEKQIASFFEPTTVEELMATADSSDDMPDDMYDTFPYDLYDDIIDEVPYDDMIDDDSFEDESTLDADESPFAGIVRKRMIRPPYTRPGRNDPCWCGSGRKYKDCHWAEDQRRDMPQAA